MDYTIGLLTKILSIYALLLIIIGTIGNLLCGVVCLSARLRPIPTFVFMGFMAFVDIFTLYWNNLSNFYRTFFGQSIMDVSSFYCKTAIWFQAFSLQASAWLLVCMTIERSLSVWIRTWRISKFNSKKAIIVSVVILVVTFFSNMDFCFGMTLRDRDSISPNATDAMFLCMGTPELIERAKAHTYMYSIIPFILLVISNGFLIYATVVGKSDSIKRTREDQLKRRSISLSVISVTLLFILMTLPAAIMSGYFPMIFTEMEQFINLLLVELGYTYHCFNFTILFIVNKQFKKEFLTIILRKNNKVSAQIVLN